MTKTHRITHSRTFARLGREDLPGSVEAREARELMERAQQAREGFSALFDSFDDFDQIVRECIPTCDELIALDTAARSKRERSAGARDHAGRGTRGRSRTSRTNAGSGAGSSYGHSRR